MGRPRGELRLAMEQAYVVNEDAYLRWAEKRKLFNQRKKEKYYYKKGVTRERRRMAAELVLQDFSGASWREVSSQIGGCREIIWEFGLWETPHDPYWVGGFDTFYVYDRLRLFPDEIQEAIADPYAWSKKIHMRTTVVKSAIIRILYDIGDGLW